MTTIKISGVPTAKQDDVSERIAAMRHHIIENSYDVVLNRLTMTYEQQYQENPETHKFEKVTEKAPGLLIDATDITTIHDVTAMVMMGAMLGTALGVEELIEIDVAKPFVKDEIAPYIILTSEKTKAAVQSQRAMFDMFLSTVDGYKGDITLVSPPELIKPLLG